MDDMLLRHRILFLSETVQTTVANHIIGRLLLLNANDQHRKIDLYINSRGGSVLDGLAIIDVMHCIQAPVSTICIGQAASIAAWILAAGTPGQRYATPNAEVMIHQIAADFSGQATDIQVHALHVSRLQKRLQQMLAAWTGKTVEQISQDMERDFFMTSEDAKSYGIIDEILQPYRGQSS